MPPSRNAHATEFFEGTQKQLAERLDVLELAGFEFVSVTPFCDHCHGGVWTWFICMWRVWA